MPSKDSKKFCNPFLSQQNPAKLLQRVKALEQDLPKVQEDWRKIMVAKQTLMDIARAQQVSNFRLLNQMCVAADLKVLTLLMLMRPLDQIFAKK
jgi:hypothetical protein